jgi:aspartyl-tRNA(Asn)/glutamyl-tRNA(Gln) amidotransferase subunit A
MIEIPTTATEAGARIRAGDLTSVELTEAVLARADSLDPLIGTYVTRLDEAALAQAEQADSDLASGIDHGPLHGVPVGVKDILAGADGPTTANSLILDREWGAGKDSPVVARLKAAGAVITGKVTTMEFAIGIPDGTKPFPTPRNPWDTETWPGGSSSGTGSGVAAGLFLAGIGTDTGGSIRIPAAFCGVSGLMPTFGRVPKSGCAPLGYSLDHIGPLARSARDCAAMLGVIAGYHPSDPDCADRPVDPYYEDLVARSGSLEGVRVGVDRVNTFGDGTDPAVAPAFEAAVAQLAALGATVVDVTLPRYAEMTAICMVTMMGEALAYHMTDLQQRWEEYFWGTRNLVARGALVNASDFVQAQRVRRVALAELHGLFSTVDVVATPTSGIAAPRYDDTSAERSLDVMGAFGLIHTAYWDPTGCPAIVVPMGFNGAGLPLSLQLGGRPFEERTLLAAADAYQLATEWHLQLPPLVRELLPA